MKKKEGAAPKKKKSVRGGLTQGLGALLAAAALLLPVQPARAAGLLVADGGFGGRLEIIEHDVDVVVNNGVAVTEVTQVFRNLENRQVEALYTFPVPEGASVSNFSMWINGTEMVGEVLEKERAREIYNSYKRRRRDPGLLEQTDYKTFEMRVFPIAPHAEQRVQIAYYQELDFDDEWATWVYPLATTTREGVDSRVQGRFAASLQVKSAVPLVAMESPSHDGSVLVTRHSEEYYEATMEQQSGDLARDVVISFKASRPTTGLDLIASKQKREDGFFSLTLTAGQELAREQKGADYVFILDVSGSMANDRKLSSSTRSIEAFVDALGDGDRFELVTFNTQPRPLFRSLTDADEENMGRAVSYLRSQEAQGGTRLQPALGTAYKYADPDRFLNVVILSDGLTEQAERRILIEAIRSRPANVRVFCVGVGNDINRPLLQQMAEDAGGMAAFISQQDNFERQARAFRSKLTHPVATDISLEIAGVEVFDLEPEEIPNLYFGMPVRVYGRYRAGGEATVRISGTVNGRETDRTATLAFPDADGGNPEIERMWAWHRLQALQEQHDMSGERQLVDEIVRIGEEFSIASEYTSFIVLENDAEYKRWKIDRRNALRIARDRDAQQRTRQQLAELRRQALDELGPVHTGGGGDGRSQVAHKPQQSTGSPAAPPVPGPAPAQRSNRSFDLPNLGGGAIGPFGAVAALLLGGGAWLSRRRRK